VSVQPGTHRLGPENATLSVHTKRAGAAAKAGHDLRIQVTAWGATLVLGDEPAATRIELTADAGSLRVQEGTGGIQALGEDDVASIHKTIDDEVLMRRQISFRSTSAAASGGDRIRSEGELTLAGRTEPIGFELAIADDGAVSATAVVKQSAWGMKPYSALFGALKVADEVEVVLEGHL
jgi:polyisoprenoid-binding protein YceI